MTNSQGGQQGVERAAEEAGRGGATEDRLMPRAQQGGQQGSQGVQGQSQGIGSPISNEAYNVVAALHSKLEGLEAYRKYQQDGGQVWQRLSQQDNQAVELLVQELERLVREGRFRLQQPGQAG